MEKTFKTAIIIEGFRLNLDPNPTHRKSPILNFSYYRIRTKYPDFNESKTLRRFQAISEILVYLHVIHA